VSLLSSPPTCKVKWYDGDYDAIALFLSNVDWYSVLNYNPSAHAAWDAFTYILQTAIRLYVPCNTMSTVTVRPRHPVHRSREITKYAAKKRSLWRELKSIPFNTYIRAKYRDCTHRLSSLIQQHETTVENRIIDSNNLGAFYSFVNKRLSHKRGITAVTDSNGVNLSDDGDIANPFTDYFASAAWGS